MSHIVFLKHVKVEDYRNIEDEFNDRLLQCAATNDDCRMDMNVKYDSIPPIFVSMGEWTKSNNIRCWTCDFTFMDIPIFIPLSIKRVDDNWNIPVMGNFCTFNCACRHIIDFLNRELLNNLVKLYDIFYDTKITKIEPSPRRHIMKKYGGYMSEEQFLGQIKKLTVKTDGHDNLLKVYIRDYEFDDHQSSDDGA